MWWGRLVLIGAAASSAVAAPKTDEPAVPETVIVRGTASCSEAQPDGTRALSWSCLNASLQAREEDPPIPVLHAKDATGRGNPEALGTFSFTATSIRMGNAFGKSAIPQRPSAPVYSNNFHPGAK